jgi:hypothetical protein
VGAATPDAWLARHPSNLVKKLVARSQIGLTIFMYSRNFPAGTVA